MKFYFLDKDSFKFDTFMQCVTDRYVVQGGCGHGKKYVVEIAKKQIYTVDAFIDKVNDEVASHLTAFKAYTKLLGEAFTSTPKKKQASKKRKNYDKDLQKSKASNKLWKKCRNDPKENKEPQSLEVVDPVYSDFENSFFAVLDHIEVKDDLNYFFDEVVKISPIKIE